jgi:ATP-dependent helicase/DNAse subunit B
MRLRNEELEIEDIVEEVLRAEKKLAKSKNIYERMKLEAIRVCKDILEIIENSNFKPHKIEAVFDENGEFAPLVLERSGLKLIGKIDRIDTFDKFFSVVDYKSRDVKESLTDLYTGRKIQIFIYAKALKNCGKVPAAAIYFPVSSKFKDEKKNSKRYEVKGVAREEFDEFKGAAAVTESEFENLMNYAVTVSEKAASEILSGYIAKNPTAGVCEYCPIGSVCDFEGEERKMRSVTKDEIMRVANDLG